MFAVGDTAAPQLLPDATYAALLTQTTRQRVEAAADPASGRLLAPGHGYRARDAVIVFDLSTAFGVTAGTVLFVRDVLPDSFRVTATTTGPALALTGTGTAVAGLVDEWAATRAVAGALATRYAKEPDRVALPSGLSASWSERVAQWNRIAAGESPAGIAGVLRARRATGFTLRRGPARDYSTGEGDAL